MVKAQFISIVNQLKNHSASLEKSNILINKAWTIIDEDNEIQRLIFKKDKSLILSKNGQAVVGNWDYFPVARSILIDRGNSDKILCSEAYIDNGVLILRLDGTENKFFILANEDVIPDLDVNNYLKNIRQIKFNFTFKELVDGKILEIENGFGYVNESSLGKKVTIDGDRVSDGKYPSKDNELILEIADSKLIQFIKIISYKNPDNIEIVIHQKNSWFISKGDLVLIGNQRVNSQTINFSKYKRLVVNDGKVEKLERKNFILRGIKEFLGLE
jgi:hypothetical protein